jgi:hypothetical protein
MNLTWFIFDLTNKQLITSSTIPQGEISDSKDVIFTETPILGNNFAPVSAGANGNRKISMQIPIINRGYEGNIGIVEQFNLLRNKSRGFLGLKRKNQWANNPKVLYYWGVGSVPLEYYVTKCNIQHTANMVNELGLPQHSVISLELTLDETSKLYKVEEVYRDITSVLGSAQTAWQGQRGYL